MSEVVFNGHCLKIYSRWVFITDLRETLQHRLCFCRPAKMLYRCLATSNGMRQNMRDLGTTVGSYIARQGHVRDVRKPQSIVGQQPAYGVFGEGRVVFSPLAKTLFGNCTDKLSIN